MITELNTSRYDRILFPDDPKNKFAMIGKRFTVSDKPYSKVSLAMGIPKKRDGDARASSALHNNGLLKLELYEGEDNIGDVLYMMMVAMFNKSSKTEEDQMV